MNKEKDYSMKNALATLRQLDEEEEAVSTILSKYPNAYVPEVDPKTGLPILPDELFGDW